MPRPSVTCVIGVILPRPNSTRYQRLLAYADAYDVTLITHAAPPRELGRLVRKTVVLRRTGWPLRAALWTLIADGLSPVVISSYAIDGLLVGIAAKLRGRRWVYEVWDHPSLTYAYGGAVRRSLRRLLYVGVRPVGRLADRVLLALHEDALKTLHVDPGRVRVVTNGVDLSWVQSVRSSSSSLSPRSLPTDTLRVVYVGAVRRERGLNLITDYLSGIGDALPFQVEFALYGHADAAALQVIDSAGTSARGKLTYGGPASADGSIKQILTSDACICMLDPAVPNYRWAYPIKVLEYMAAGAVTIATRSPATERLLSDGDTGYLVSYSIEGLTQGLGRAMASYRDGSVVSLKERAFQSAIEFDWQGIRAEVIRAVGDIVVMPHGGKHECGSV